MRERTRPLLAALSFLTVIPIGGIRFDRRDLRRGAAWFPVVGAAVGGLAAAVAWGAALVLPALPAGVLGVATGVAVTGAIHLDGLGDVADGIGTSLTGRDPVDAMRDPRLGTFGVAAVALDLLLKTSVLAWLAARGFPWELVAAGSLARVGSIVLAWRLPYVGGGTGGWVADVGPGVVSIATIVGLAVAAPCAALGTPFMVLGVAVAAVIVGSWSRRRLGGITGDGFGAAAELGETLALVAAVAAR